MYIELKNINKSFGDFKASDNVSFGIEKGKLIGLFPNHRSLSVLFVSYPVSWIITIVLQVVCFYFVRKRVHQKEKRLL